MQENISSVVNNQDSMFHKQSQNGNPHGKSAPNSFRFWGQVQIFERFLIFQKLYYQLSKVFQSTIVPVPFLVCRIRHCSCVQPLQGPTPIISQHYRTSEVHLAIGRLKSQHAKLNSSPKSMDRSFDRWIGQNISPGETAAR